MQNLLCENEIAEHEVRNLFSRPRFDTKANGNLFERHGDWINFTNGQVRDNRHLRSRA